jgi:hypothetical protein
VSKELVLRKAISHREYEHRIQTCVGSNLSNLYFAFGNHFQLSYSQSNLQSGEARLLVQISDKAENYSLMEYLRDADAAAAMGDAKKAYEMRMWYQKILTKIPRGLLLASDTGAVVMDLSRDSAICFSLEGEPLKQVYIPFAKEFSAESKILKDQASGYHYLAQETRGIYK